MARTPSSDAEPRVGTRSLRKPGLSKTKFEAVFKGGKRVSTSNFRLTADKGEGRVGVATSKKIGCHARRNWVKRRIRESIYSFESSLRTDLDYIVIATPNVLTMDFVAIREELKDATRRMNERWDADLESG
ncbi:MAG: ribonuclease P protein component [Chlorobia bacterium]|nr:ribonuclease P protein component [Fimbriimonadaceae bacterium]